MGFIEFFAGVLFTIITVIVKDAVLKNTHKHNIETLNKNYEVQEKVNQAQEAEIRTNREETLALKSSMLNLRERFDNFNEMHREEMKEIQVTLKDTTRSIASLDATLKGLSKWLDRVERKFDDKTKTKD
jgi:uncharacterized protein YlxW (UPF0749 family)